jgi:ribosomal protein S18 acetylase RimI-like enzyme
VRIRLAEAAEAEVVSDLVQRAYGHYVERIGMRPGPMDDDHVAQIGLEQLFVVEDEDAIAGLVVLSAYDDHLLVENVAVDPARQGEGIGRALLAHAEAVARRAGLPTLRLYTNAAMWENIALYSSLGWEETERRKEKGFERVFFIKWLDPAPPA